MKNVVFTPEVRLYFKELIPVLYQLEYFSFLENSRNYVKELVEDIRVNLPLLPHKLAPEYFDQYGKNMYYATFRKNRQTTWYAFFTIYEEHGNRIYLVRYIANNHIVAKYL